MGQHFCSSGSTPSRCRLTALLRSNPAPGSTHPLFLQLLLAVSGGLTPPQLRGHSAFPFVAPALSQPNSCSLINLFWPCTNDLLWLKALLTPLASDQWPWSYLQAWERSHPGSIAVQRDGDIPGGGTVGSLLQQPQSREVNQSASPQRQFSTHTKKLTAFSYPSQPHSWESPQTLQD